MNENRSRRRAVGRRSTGVEALERRAMLTAVVVNTTVDALFPGGSGTVSLRNAVADANASASATTITFDASVFAAAQTVKLNGNALELSNTAQPTTIIGPAAGVTLDAGGSSGVLSVDAGVTATASHLVATHGTGAIANAGTLTLTDSSITDSTATPHGGGLDNTGTATLTDDTVSGNQAYFGGGAFSSGTITVTRCTFSGDTSTGEAQVYASAGAGLYVSAGPATLVNDTFAGNRGTDGNGVYAYANGTVTLSDCTVAANVGGSGIFSSGDATDFTLVNSIVAGNTGQSAGGDASGSFNSLGYNLVGETDGSTGWNADDRVGTVAGPLAADLGGLGDNGGPTATLLPAAGSPAIGHGSVAMLPAGLTTDQRGDARTTRGNVDIGSVQTSATVAVTGPGNQAATVGAATSLALGTFVQGGTAGPYAVAVDWGDGSAATTFTVAAPGPIPAQAHTYAATGSDRVTVRVTDASGDATGTATFSVAVTATPVAAATSLTLQSSAASVATAGPLTLTAAVSPAAAAGTVTFYDGAAELGTAPLTAGVATLAVAGPLSVGTHSLTASYAGNADFQPSTAAAVAVTVTPAATATATTLAASSTSKTQAQAVTLTAAVTAPATLAGGVVTFVDNGVTLGTATVAADGVAALTTAALPPGANAVTADYAGDAAFQSSTSAAVTVQVTDHALVPQVLRAAVPATTVAGAAFRGSVRARLTNGLSDAEAGDERGAFAVRVYASPTTAVDPQADAVVATLQKTADVRPGKSLAVAVPIVGLPATLAAGVYHLLLRTTDARGNTEDVDTGATVTVALPVVQLTATFAAVQRNVSRSGAAVALVDAGNVTDAGPFTATIGLSSDAAGQDVVATGPGLIRPAKLALRPARVAKIRVTGWAPLFGTLPTGSYYLTVTLTDAAGHAASAVSRQPVES